MKRTKKDFSSTENKKKKLETVDLALLEPPLSPLEILAPEYWENMPDDTKNHLFSFLDNQSLFKISQVSKESRQFTEEMFQQRIQRYMPNFSLGNNSGLSYKLIYNSFVLGFFEPLAQGHNINRSLEKGPYKGIYLLHAYVALFTGDQFFIRYNLIGQINQADEYGAVPLCYALQTGNSQSAQWLLSNNADINVISNSDKAITLIPHYNYINLYRGANMLHYAVLSGKVEIAQLLFKSNPQVVNDMLSKTTASGLTPIHVACQSRNPQMIRFLVEKLQEDNSLYTKISKVSLNISERTNDADTIFKAMKLCIEEKNIDLLRKMLEISWIKSHINDFDNSGNCLVSYAIRENQPAILKLLLSSGASIEAVVERRIKVFTLAVLLNAKECIRVLMNQDLIVYFPELELFLEYNQYKYKETEWGKDKQDKYIELWNELCDFVKELDLGVIVAIQPINNNHPKVDVNCLHHACEYNKERRVVKIFENGGRKFVNLKDEGNGITPLMYLVKRGVFNRGAGAISLCNLMKIFPSDWGVILYFLIKENFLAEYNKRECMEELFKAGKKSEFVKEVLEQDNNDGFVLKKYFREKTLEEFKELIISKRFQIPEETVEKIFKAVKLCKFEYILSLLIENGANINLQDRYGWTVLHHAYKHSDVLFELFNLGCDPKIGDFFYWVMSNFKETIANFEQVIRALEVYSYYKYPPDENKSALHIAIEVFNNPHRAEETREILNALIYTKRTRTFVNHSLFKVESKDWIFKCDVNIEDSKGETPIFTAIRANNIVAVEVLIAQGAFLSSSENSLRELLEEKFDNKGVIYDMIMKQFQKEVNHRLESMDYGDHEEDEEEQERIRQEGWSP